MRRAIWAIAIKDLRERLRDRSALLIAVAVPLGLAAVFAAILADVTGESITFDYALARDDVGQAGAAFESEVLASLEAEGLIRLRRVDAVAARDLVEDHAVDAAFLIPAGFSAAVEAGMSPVLTVIGDPDQPIATEVARSIAVAYTQELAAVQLAVATAVATGAADPSALAQRAAAIRPPLRIVDASTERRQLDPTTFFAAGMAVFFLFFTVQFGVSSVFDERRFGTLSRMLAAPIPRVAILAGKLFTSFVLGLASTAVLVLASSLLLGAEWGNAAGVALLLVGGVLAATGIMAVVATLARTADQAGALQAIIAVVLGMLGGSFFPVAVAGGVIERVSLVTPHAWFLRGLGELAGGGSIAAALPAVGALVAFAAVSWAIAVVRLGKLVSP